jgi:hypothetical protein
MVLLENCDSFVAPHVEALPEKPGDVTSRGTDAHGAPRAGVGGRLRALGHAPGAWLVTREKDSVTVSARGGVGNLLERDRAEGQPEPLVQANRGANEQQIRERHENKRQRDHHLHRD